MVPSRDVLFPTDLSPAAAASLPLAGVVAEALGARLVVYHVVPIPVAEYAAWGAGDEEGVWARADAAARREITALAAGLRVPVEIVVRHDAPSARVLVDLSVLDEVRRSRPRMVVMPMHSRSGLARFFVGSVTEEVVRHAPVPVLALRDPEPGAADPFRRIVVATDLSPASRRVFAPAAELARSFGARIVVVHAAPHGEALPTEEDVRAFVRAELGEVSARVATGPAWRAIVGAAAELGAGLVAVGRHGVDSPGDGILGSTTDRVLRQAPCHVLVA